MEANDDLEAGFIAELDTAEEAELTSQQKDDLQETAEKSTRKLEELKGLIQEALWTQVL